MKVDISKNYFKKPNEIHFNQTYTRMILKKLETIALELLNVSWVMDIVEKAMYVFSYSL